MPEPKQIPCPYCGKLFNEEDEEFHEDYCRYNHIPAGTSTDL